MELELKTIRKSLNKAFLRETIHRNDFDRSVITLRALLQNMDQALKAGETEEHYKFFLPDFFKGMGFSDHYINTDGYTDLAIHNGKRKQDPVGVMMETKQPGSSEMISPGRPNRKAMQEAVLYYLRERLEKGNTDDKHIIITDLKEWFIFDAQEFHRHFIENGPLKREFKKWKADQKSSSNNPFMYGLIADYLESYTKPIGVTHFSFHDFRSLIEKENPTDEEELELVPLIKLLSPVHLLKKQFRNDNNNLDRQFYHELLYILGLEEHEKGSAKLIARLPKDKRFTGSLIENTISTLRYENRLAHISEPEVAYGEDTEDQLFGVALELCILWTNRILFLKLLEAQLFRYHRGDLHFKFLNFEKVDEFDELNKLFFRVLAIREEDREASEKEKYGHIPYLNSSLFDISALEDKTTRISGLDDKVTMPVYAKTVLKDSHGKRLGGQELNTLEYLFRFLEAYNFSAEGKEEIQEENKSLINASVLGLIFEKINGYKDGSYYTPGFITEYMCRETLRKAVVEKFKDALSLNSPSPSVPLPQGKHPQPQSFSLEGEGCPAGQDEGEKALTFSDLYNYIGPGRPVSIKEANALVDSITVCDPAVGSGHFLVSALNEFIAIKSELGIFCDAQYKAFRGTKVHIDHDELVVTHGDDELFEYNLKGVWKNGHIERSINSEKQRLQQALFEEKRRLIENSLFGVDINPNSVKICQLRLWIELLKHAYYTGDSNHQKLKALPNIDINIKQGNSLVSRFALDADMEQILRKADYTLDDYKQAVADYKETRDRPTKYKLRGLIKSMKEAFSVGLEELHPERRKLKEVQAALIREQTQHDMFGDDDEHGGSREMRVSKLEKKVAKQRAVVDDLEAATFYRQAFEWRFEFPEVLDEDGAFTGFDVVIGNPPYLLVQNLKDAQIYEYLKNQYKTATYKIDLFALFIEESMNLIKNKTTASLIVPYTWLSIRQHKLLRKKLLENRLIKIIDLPKKVFESSDLDTTIIIFQKGSLTNKIKIGTSKDGKISDTRVISSEMINEDTNFHINLNVSFDDHKILEKIESYAVDLDSQFEVSQGYIPYRRSDLIKEYGDEKGNKIVDERLWHSEKRINDSFEPEIQGRDLKRYYCPEVDVKKFIKYGNHVAGYVKEKFFKNPRVLIMEITRGDYYRITATYIEDEYYNTPSIINVINSNNDKKKVKYLAGLLNSRLFTWYHEKRHSKSHAKTSIPKILVTEVRRLPLISNYNEDIGKVVNDIISTRQGPPDADTSALEAEVDQLVYELYGLSEEEIGIVEGSVG